MNKKHIEVIKSIFKNEIIFDEKGLKNYGSDETEDLNFPPNLVVFPTSTAEVSNLIKYCYQNNIVVTPAGAQTGLSGGSIPVKGGVLISFSKMNAIIEVDTKNMQVTTEPGVITQVLQDTVKEKGLFYPPDPASAGSCFIGGNIAENSGGPKAVKYGVTSDFVLNLEVVLPNGDIIWTGANVLKNATGYNLTQLMVGSEGTLGIITKIVLKLLPHPTHDKLLLVPFKKAREACEAVAAIFNAGITPSGLEFMEKDAINFTLQHFPDLNLEVKEDHNAHLLIEVDGFNEEVLFNDCQKIMSVVEKYDIDEVLFAESEAQKNQLWSIRKKVGEAVKAFSVYKEEDTVVPRYALPDLLENVKQIGEKYGFKSVCYGHAGDGNLHVNIVKGNLSEKEWKEILPKGIEEIFKVTVELGGTLSGEHGIGLVQKQYMRIAFNEIQLDLMRKIKDLFDPKGILNPGKIV